MSAYMVEREHINYLVSAAMSRQMQKPDSAFRWFYNREWHQLEHGDREMGTKVGQMLWDENLKSINARYPDTIGNNENIPGKIGETYIYAHSKTWGGDQYPFDPVQVIMSIRCLRYQSCEHDNWEDSEAHAFLEALLSHAINKLPGMDKAKWGAPDDPRAQGVNLSKFAR